MYYRIIATGPTKARIHMSSDSITNFKAKMLVTIMFLLGMIVLLALLGIFGVFLIMHLDLPIPMVRIMTIIMVVVLAATLMFGTIRGLRLIWP